MSHVWEDQFNARCYEEYGQQFPMYRQLGQMLIAQAEPLRVPMHLVGYQP